MLIQFTAIVFPELLGKVGNSARICIELPHNSEYPPRCLEHFARVVRVAGRETDTPSVAFEIYRTRVRTRKAAAPEGDPREGRPAGHWVQ